MTEQTTTKPFQSTAQQRFAFGTGQPWAKRWARETDFAKLPKRVRKKIKAAATTAGPALHGPGALLGTPGMGRGRKWGNRRKDKDCTCGVATKESLGPGITRIRGNLCNVHGRYGPCDASLSGKKKPKGGKGKLPKTLTTTPDRDRNQERMDRRDQVLADMGIDPGASEALVMLRNGEQPPADAFARMGAVEAGLVEQAADGTLRMTPSGRALISAAEAGDPGRAGDIIGAARDRKAARTTRERAAAQKKLDSIARQVAAGEKKPPVGGGGGKKGGGASSGGGAESADRVIARQQREQERQEDRKKRESERLEDRAQRKREQAEDRAQRQQERDEDRQAQLDERRQRGRGTGVPAGRVPIQMPSRKRRPNATLAKTKAQSAQDKAMFAKMGGGGGGGGKGGGGGGGGSKLWKRDPETGKRKPTEAQRDAQQQGEIRRLAVSDKQRDTFARRAGDKAEHETRQRYRVESMGDGDYTLRDYNRATSSYRGVSVASGSKDKVDKALNTKVRTARTRAENDARQSVSFYNSDVRSGMYPNPSSAKRDRDKFKTFTVFKDDTDAWRWVARTTTAYRDRDGEIITTKALEDDAARMTATKQYGPLRYWHIGNPDPLHPTAPWGVGLDIGTCDYSIVIGRTSIESGTFNSPAIGAAFAQSAGDYELSPGFFHPPSDPDPAGEYHTIRRFERSVVPVAYGRASNLFTGMTVKEHRMDQQTYDARVKAFLEDMNRKGVPEHAAAAALSGMEQADKSARQQGIAFKSDDAPAVFTAPDGTPGLIVDGRFVALKAAAIETEDDGDMEVEIEEGADDDGGEMEEEAEGEYIGDLTPAEFWMQLKNYLAELLAPQAKMEELAKSFASGLGEMKALYTTKDAGTVARIAALERELATLKGDQPAVVNPADIEAALKGGPQAPPDPNAPQIPEGATPVQALAMRTMPGLYQTNGAGGFVGWTPPAPSQS